MGAIIRIVFGIAILAGALILRGKATPSSEEEEVSLSLMGTSIAPSSLHLIVLAFALVGVAMIVMGAIALVKRR